MSFKSTQSERGAARERPDRRPEHDPRRPWLNTRPRGGNGPTDHRDLERSLEKLEALIGR